MFSLPSEHTVSSRPPKLVAVATTTRPRVQELPKKGQGIALLPLHVHAENASDGGEWDIGRRVTSVSQFVPLVTVPE